MVGRNVECHLPSLDNAIIDNCPAGYQQAQVISPCSLLDFNFGHRRPQPHSIVLDWAISSSFGGWGETVSLSTSTKPRSGGSNSRFAAASSRLNSRGLSVTHAARRGLSAVAISRLTRFVVLDPACTLFCTAQYEFLRSAERTLPVDQSIRQGSCPLPVHLPIRPAVANPRHMFRSRPCVDTFPVGRSSPAATRDHF